MWQRVVNRLTLVVRPSLLAPALTAGVLGSVGSLATVLSENDHGSSNDGESSDGTGGLKFFQYEDEDEEEDCENPICQDAKDAFRAYAHFGFDSMSSADTSTGKVSSLEESSSSDASLYRRSQTKVSEYDYHAEAPDRQMLGNNTWTLLHSMSVYYPKKASEQRQKDTLQFLTLLSRVYPCKICAADLADLLERFPPKLNGRDEFAEWMCDIHNQVNQQTGKPQFDCAKLWQRWRRDFTGDVRDVYAAEWEETEEGSEEGVEDEDDDEGPSIPDGNSTANIHQSSSLDLNNRKRQWS